MKNYKIHYLLVEKKTFVKKLKNKEKNFPKKRQILGKLFRILMNKNSF
jgi:hypothetical protein